MFREKKTYLKKKKHEKKNQWAILNPLGRSTGNNFLSKGGLTETNILHWNESDLIHSHQTETGIEHLVGSVLKTGVCVIPKLQYHFCYICESLNTTVRH